MKRHLGIRAALVLGSLAAFMAVGLAAAQSVPKVGSGDIVADRKRLMKLNWASLADLQAKAKAGNIEAIAGCGARNQTRSPPASHASGVRSVRERRLALTASSYTTGAC